MSAKVSALARLNRFQDAGYVVFPAEAATRLWAEAALVQARHVIISAQQAHQWQCAGTWFVGVDALPNGADGAIASAPLAGQGVAFAQALFGEMPLHPAQLSVLRPGYPQPRGGESAAAFGYRRNRDAAHVDGLLPVAPTSAHPTRRRCLREPHGWILGLCLSEAGAGASPLVVWDGAHRILGPALSRLLQGKDPASWPEVDLTEVYQAARREVFETCPRRKLTLQPGEVVVLHRHLLHGIAPWEEGAGSAPEGRIMAYFRPQLSCWEDWLMKDRPT